MSTTNNDDPNFEQRLILAFALTVLLFLFVLPYFSKKSAMPSLPEAQKTSSPQPAAAAPALPAGAATAAPTPAAPKRGAAAVAPAPTPAIAAPHEQTVTVHTPVFSVVLSNRGATAQSWVLKQYKDDNGRPLNLVDPQFSGTYGYPLAFWSADAGLRQQLDQALYQVTESHGTNGDTILEFRWSNGDLQASKRLVFNSGYVVQLTSSVTRNGQPVETAIAWPGAFGDRAVPGDFNTEQLFREANGSLTTTAAKKVTNNQAQSGSYHFAGIEDQFFATAFLPSDDRPVQVTTFKNSYSPKLVDASGHVISNSQVDTVGLAVADGPTNDLRLFVGPKKIDLLKSIDPALRELVDFGWFSFIADPLFLWMNWTYAHWIHNYGWVILFITFVITMAAFPLRMRAQKSQSKMLALQPKINALNAKAKRYPMRDPRRQEVQAEVMKVYSEHGVNPFGGCLPMLIQLPLIYAFWRVLDYAIELRHAPWIGYIHDLSARDPYYVLPLLVVGAQFISTSLMPMAPGQDPRQAKMMRWMMPALMGWFFFYLPSGVNLYYLFSMLIGAGQQWVANRTYNAAAVAAVAATEAKRSGKGGGKNVIDGKAVSKR